MIFVHFFFQLQEDFHLFVTESLKKLEKKIYFDMESTVRDQTPINNNNHNNNNNNNNDNFGQNDVPVMNYNNISNNLNNLTAVVKNLKENTGI